MRRLHDPRSVEQRPPSVHCITSSSGDPLHDLSPLCPRQIFDFDTTSPLGKPKLFPLTLPKPTSSLKVLPSWVRDKLPIHTSSSVSPRPSSSQPTLGTFVISRDHPQAILRTAFAGCLSLCDLACVDETQSPRPIQPSPLLITEPLCGRATDSLH